MTEYLLRKAKYDNLLTLKNNRFFKTWLTRILISKCRDILHRRKQMLY